MIGMMLFLPSGNTCSYNPIISAVYCDQSIGAIFNCVDKILDHLFCEETIYMYIFIHSQLSQSQFNLWTQRVLSIAAELRWPCKEDTTSSLIVMWRCILCDGLLVSFGWWSWRRGVTIQISSFRVEFHPLVAGSCFSILIVMRWWHALDKC